MLKQVSIVSLLSVVAFGISTVGFAGALIKTPSVYVEGNLGYGKMTEEISGTPYTDSRRDGIAGSVNAGYQFNPYFAIEEGFAMLSNTSFHDNGNLVARGKENYYLDLAAKVIIPLSTTGVSAFAKAGIAGAHHTFEVGPGYSSPDAASFFRAVALGGIGLSYAFTDRFAMNVQGDATSKSKESSGTIAPMYLLTAGLDYHY